MAIPDAQTWKHRILQVALGRARANFTDSQSIRVMDWIQVDLGNVIESLLRAYAAEVLREVARELWHSPNAPDGPRRYGDRAKDRLFAVAELRQRAQEMERGGAR